VGGKLSTYVEKINTHRNFVGKPEGRGVDGKKILIRIYFKEGVWNAVNWTLLHPFRDKRQTVTIFRFSQNNQFLKSTLPRVFS
jgi:hypothetical protein